MKIINNFKEIVKVLEKNDNFLITSHINIDGDAIGSELAFHFILKKLNKKSVILNQDKLPKTYLPILKRRLLEKLEKGYL